MLAPQWIFSFIFHIVESFDLLNCSKPCTQFTDTQFVDHSGNISTSNFSLKALWKDLIQPQNDDYGAIVLDIGPGWELKPLNSERTRILAGLQTSFPKTLPKILAPGVALFLIENFTQTLPGAAVVSPNVSFSYSNTSQNCEKTKLLLVPMKWDAGAKQRFKDFSNVIDASYCKNCTILTIPRSLIAICPLGRWEFFGGEDTTTDTTSSTTQQLSSMTTSTTTTITSIPSTTTTPETTTVEKTSTSVEFTTSTQPAGTTTTQSDPTTVTVLTSTLAPDVSAQFTDDLLSIEIPIESSSTNCNETFITNMKKSRCIPGNQRLEVELDSSLDLKVGSIISLRDGRMAQIEAPQNPVSPNFHLQYDQNIIPCNPTADIFVKHITGSGHQSPTFYWSSIDSNFNEKNLTNGTNQRNISIQTENLHETTTFLVTVCNFVGKCTKSDPVEFTLVNSTAELNVRLSGIPEKAYPSSELRISPTITFTDCDISIENPSGVQFLWTVGNEVRQTGILNIPANSFEIGDISNVSIVVNYKDPKTNQSLEAKQSAQIEFIPENLLLFVDSTEKEIPSDSILTIDASASIDPNLPSAVLSHSWTCIDEKNSTFQLANDVNTFSSILTIPANSLKQGSTLIFTDFVISSSDVNGSISVIIHVIQPLLPVVSFQPLTKDVFSVDDYIRIQGHVFSSLSPTLVTWDSVITASGNFVDISTFTEHKSINYTDVSRQMMVFLTIPPQNKDRWTLWSGLSRGETYTIRLLAVNKLGRSYADITFHTSSISAAGGITMKVPDHQILAPIEASLGDGWSTTSTTFYRFGYEITYTDGSVSTAWMQRSSSTESNLYLPSGTKKSPGCGSRVSSRILLEVCDNGNYHIVKSDSIELQSPQNTTQALEMMKTALSTDQINGNPINAIARLFAMVQENCGNLDDPYLADSTTTAMLKTINDKSSAAQYSEVLDSLLLVLPMTADLVLLDATQFLINFQTKFFPIPKKPSHVQKRSTDIADSSTVSPLNITDFNTTLKVYDNFINNQLNIGVVYFNFFSTMAILLCKGMDSQSTTAGTLVSNYSRVLFQALDANTENFVNKSYVIDNSPKAMVSFSPYFKSVYSQYTCESGSSCTHSCLYSTSTSEYSWRVNQALQQYIFGGQFSSVDSNHSISDLFGIFIVDPTNAAALNLRNAPSILFVVKIPLNKYSLTDYYACYVYQEGEDWDTQSCSAGNYAEQVDELYYVSCKCVSAGYIGVFTITPPTPPDVPAYREILFEMVLNMSSPSSFDKQSFSDRLSSASALDKRIICCTMKNSSVFFTLRPRSNPSQIANSNAVQMILRILNPFSGFLISPNVELMGLEYSPIKRNLSHDGNARKITMTLNKSFQSVNNSALGSKWINSLASNLFIAPYRFKNPLIAPGIIFNFTITKPLEQEKNPLSAEEISLLILECTQYGELSVISNQDEMIRLPELSLQNVVELRVLRESNALVIALTIIIGLSIMIVLLYVSGAVVVKLRTDRLIQEERRRMLMVQPRDLAPPPPLYGQAMVPGGTRLHHR